MTSPDRPWLRMLRTAAVALALVTATLVLERSLRPHYPIQRWLFWRYAQYWLVGLVFSLVCTSGGFLAVRKLGPAALPFRERLLMSMAVGVLLFFFGMFAGGLLGLYGSAFAVAWPVVLGLSGAWPLYRYLKRARPHLAGAAARAQRWSRPQLVAIALGGLGLVMVYANILTPDNISYDSRWYHMAVPEHYAAAKGITRSQEGWFHMALPQLACLIYVWPYLMHWLTPFDQVLMAAHLEFVLFVWTLLSVGPCVRWLVPKAKTPAAWAAYFLFSGIFCYDSTLNGGADHIAAFWAIPILLTLRRAWRAFELRPSVLLGLMLAGAAHTKAQSIELLVFPCAAVAVRGAWLGIRAALKRPAPAGGGRFGWLVGPLVVAGVMLLATTPFWLKNWIWYGDPIYPALYKHLNLRPWHEDMGQFYATLVERHFWRPTGTRVEKLRETVTTLFTFAFKPHDWEFMHKDWPVFGFLFTLSWFVMPFIRASRRVWGVFVGGHVGVATWFLFSHQDRYLQIIVPWMVVHVAAVIVLVWRMGWFARVPLLGLLTLQVVWGTASYFIPAHVRVPGGRPLPHLFDLFSTGYRKVEKDRLRVFGELIDVGKAVPPSGKILAHRFEPHAGLRHRVVHDHPSWQGLISYGRQRSQRSVWELYKKLGVTHILWQNTNVLAEDTLGGDLRFFGFVTQSGRNEKQIGGNLLAEMPDAPPSESLSDAVLYLGCHGYKPGLYELTDLSVFELGNQEKRYAAPREALGAAQQPRVDELAGRANYVVTSAKCSGTPLPGTLGSAFVQRGNRYEENLYVRKVPLQR
ncbi:MAG: hypothetical protein IT377_27405 [Polyangiaceae bacterium]|nr:hypothetical protein [Polyangiaceae bacterium]